MYSRRTLLILVTAVAISGAGWVQLDPAGGREARVTILEQSSSGTTFEVTIPGLDVSPRQLSGAEYSEVSIPGAAHAPLEEGRPAVPVVPVLLAVPNGASVDVRIEARDAQKLAVSRVSPVQRRTRWADEPASVVQDTAFYGMDVVHPGECAKLVHLARWRELNVALVHVYPVQVNPGRGELDVATRVVVRATYSGGTYPAAVAGWMMPMYARLVHNFEQLRLLPAADDPAAVQYMVFVHEPWWNDPNLARMLAWIEQRGYKVAQYVVQDGTSPEYIKELIWNEYRSHNPAALRWVLLVGDWDRDGGEHGIPMKGYPNPLYPDPEMYPHRFGDYWYSDLREDLEIDYYPEVGIGRLSPSGADDLGAQVRRILNYQLDPRSPDPAHPYDWLSTMTLVCCDGVPRPPSSIQAMQVVQGLPLGYFSFQRNLIDGHTQGNGVVSDAVNSGTGSLVYFGHGAPQQWADWGPSCSWTSEQVDALVNGPMTPVVVQWGCDAGYILDPNSVTESWMRQGENGAVATLGSMHEIRDWSTNSDALNYFAYALGDNTHPISHGGQEYPDPAFNLGSTMMLMTAAQMTCPGRGVAEDRANILSFLALGEPSMPIWSGGEPKHPLVTYPLDMTPGAEFEVNVTVEGRAVEGALVCVQDGGSVYETGRTDATGIARLTVPVGSPPGEVTLTVSEGHAATTPHTPILPFVTRTWTEIAEVLRTPTDKPVKDGGALATSPVNGQVYALKGYKTPDFYSYDPSSGLWAELRTIPQAPGGNKDVYKGGALAAGTNGYVYAVKGNGTKEFWRFSTSSGSWGQNPLEPVHGRHGAEAGTALAYVEREGVRSVYMVKGDEPTFWRYDVAANSWDSLAWPPSDDRRWKGGSWLVYDGDHTLYAHKAKVHQLWAYDIASGAWNAQPLQGMPLVGRAGRSKKSRDGGCAAYRDGFIHALKGGNTQEFWRYSVALNSWTELETMPSFGSTGKKKRVSRGGALTCAGSHLYALKGNKTREFWRYAPAPVVVPAGDWAGLPPAVERAGPQPGGQQTDIENPICEGYFASRPRWRPDGGAVCYSREDEAGWLQVYMVPTNPPGPEVRLTLEPTDHEAPVFSPNGQWVAFAMLDTVTDCYQIAKVPAIPMPSPAIVLTSDPFDHEYPEWNFTSNWLVYQKDDFTSYAQLWRVPANGGPEQPLTGDAADHEWPSYLTPNEVVFQRGAAGDYEHIWKLNLMTMEQMPLTTGGYEHENPCPAYFGTSVAYQGMDPSGTWQIGLVSSNGGGEHFLTNEQCFDLEEPDWSADLNSIFCVRWVGFGREIGRVDATMGGYVPCTDGSAIRDNPDTYWHPDLGWNFVIYERENLGLFGDGGSDDPRRKPRPGTGIFLTRARRAEGGPMTAGLTGVALHQALPNPARGRVNIRWQVPQETDVSLTVYDASGRLVRTLAQGRTRPGEYTSVWDGTDSQGQSVAAGVYFYSLSTGSDLLRRKVVLAE